MLTLQLLFPPNDLESLRYLKKKTSRCFPEVHVKVPEQVYLSDFSYWHDRLSELLSESQAPPTTFDSTWPTLRLLWNDRRNPHQWWTFWFAATILLLTLIFGIITVVATCMQTNYTRLQLARTPFRQSPDNLHHRPSF